MEFQEINFMLKLISFLTILWRARCQGLDQMVWGHDEELQTPAFIVNVDTVPGYGHKPEY